VDLFLENGTSKRLECISLERNGEGGVSGCGWGGGGRGVLWGGDRGFLKPRYTSHYALGSLRRPKCSWLEKGCWLNSPPSPSIGSGLAKIKHSQQIFHYANNPPHKKYQCQHQISDAA